MHLRTVFCGVFVLSAGCTNTTRGSLPDIDAAFGGDNAGGRGGEGGTGTGGSAGTGGGGGSGGVAGGGAVAGIGGSGGNGDASMDAAMTCVTGKDCPPSPSVCRIAVCNGTCSYELAAAGPASVQVSGDCRRVDCESNGVANSVVDNTDSDDLNPCTSDSCTSGFATHTALAGTPCNNGAGTCDASGQCVDCSADADCGVATP